MPAIAPTEAANFRQSSQANRFLLLCRDVNSDMHMAGHLTPLGWTMLALYLFAALLSFRTGAVFRSGNSVAMGRAWICLGAILTALGLNKPIDLQTLVIELGRYVTFREHLFPYRLELYAIFFLGFMLTIMAFIAVLMLRFSTELRTFARQFPLAIGGCGLICAYIIIRATSIDNVDLMLRFNLAQVPFLWLLEAGGLLLIMVQTFRTAPMR